MDLGVVDFFRLGYALEHQDHGGRTAVTLIGSKVAFSTRTGSCIIAGLRTEGGTAPGGATRLELPAGALAGEAYRFGPVVSFPKVLICQPGFRSRVTRQRSCHGQTHHPGSSSPFERPGEQASNVAPVVNTSSTSKTRSLSTCARYA